MTVPEPYKSVKPLTETQALLRKQRDNAVYEDPFKGRNADDVNKMNVLNAK